MAIKAPDAEHDEKPSHSQSSSSSSSSSSSASEQSSDAVGTEAVAHSAQWGSGDGKKDKIHFLQGSSRVMPPCAMGAKAVHEGVGIDEIRQNVRQVCKKCLSRMGLTSEFVHSAESG